MQRLALMLPVAIAVHALVFGGALLYGKLRETTPEGAIAMNGATLAQPSDEEPVPIETDPAGGAGAHEQAPADPQTRPAPAQPEGDGAKKPRAPASPPNKAKTASAASPASSASADPSNGGAPAQWGATGDRSATDLARSFTRAFPQAASTDPVWATAPFGDAGSASLVVVLDENGKIESTRVNGAPSAQLRAGIARTLQLIKGRSFVARAKTTQIFLAARVSPDQVHDGLHGDVFAIGGDMSGSTGSAFFALAIGRRIDLTVSAR